jgi:hypothetical protein
MMEKPVQQDFFREIKESEWKVTKGVWVDGVHISSITKPIQSINECDCDLPPWIECNCQNQLTT